MQDIISISAIAVDADLRRRSAIARLCDLTPVCVLLNMAAIIAVAEQSSVAASPAPEVTVNA